MFTNHSRPIEKIFAAVYEDLYSSWRLQITSRRITLYNSTNEVLYEGPLKLTIFENLQNILSIIKEERKRVDDVIFHYNDFR